MTTGTGTGLSLGPVGAAFGAVIGMVGGLIVAHIRENQLEETRMKLRRCEDELNDCGNVVERCREILRKSEEELKELQNIVSELEKTFKKL